MKSSSDLFIEQRELEAIEERHQDRKNDAFEKEYSKDRTVPVSKEQDFETKIRERQKL